MNLGYLMEMGLLVALGVLPVLAGLVLLVAALLDLARRPAPVWEATGHSQLVWVVIVVFVGLIGPLLYLIVARPELERASRGAVASR